MVTAEGGGGGGGELITMEPPHTVLKIFERPGGTNLVVRMHVII